LIFSTKVALQNGDFSAMKDLVAQCKFYKYIFFQKNQTMF